MLFLRLAHDRPQVARLAPVVRDVPECNSHCRKCSSLLRELCQGSCSEGWTAFVQIEHVDCDLPLREDSGLFLIDQDEGVQAVDRRAAGNIE